MEESSITKENRKAARTERVVKREKKRDNNRRDRER